MIVKFMRNLKTSFLWALAACLLSMGTALTPWFTLSTRSAQPEVSRDDECIFEGPSWRCERPHEHYLVLEDPGASSWQEIPAQYFYNLHLSQERPLWNPYIGSGYPIFLDGTSRPVAPSRAFLNHFPSDGARDLLIFMRIFVWVWGILFVLMELGVTGPFLILLGIASSTLPYPSRYIDHVFLDVDLLAPWVLALFLAFIQKKNWGKKHLILALVFGLWIGAQTFIESQIVFCCVLGFLAVATWYVSRGKSLLVLFVYSLGFFAICLPYALEFKHYFPLFATNRDVMGCIATEGVGLSKLWTAGYIGYLKNSELFTVFSVLGMPLCIWGMLKKPDLRFLFGFYCFLFIWLAFGNPSLVCGIEGISAISFPRHLYPHIQALFFILVSSSLFLVSSRFRFRRVLLLLGFIFCIYPVLNRSIVVLKHLGGKFPKAVDFSPRPIPQGNIFAPIQKLSQEEDRRHFSPDRRMYPNYSEIFEILDVRVLYGVFPKRISALNNIFLDWFGNNPGHADRFVGPNDKFKGLPADLEKVLLLHRVSLLSFSKNQNWLEGTQFYNSGNCKKTAEDQVAVFYFCPIVGGIGYFPKEILASSGIDQSLEILKAKSVTEVLDFLVVEGAATENFKVAAGKILNFKRTPNQLEYELEVVNAGYFVVADTYFSGWKASINGQAAEILPANVGFKTVFVPKGKTQLKLRYIAE